MSTMSQVFSGHRARQAQLAATSSTNPLARGIAYVEGKLVPLHEARIPLLDQGFVRGDLTYDVPAVWDGRFFRLDDHLDRLEASCQKMRLRLPLSKPAIRKLLIEMVRRTGIRDVFVELIVTRGLQRISIRPSDPSAEELQSRNHLYMWVMPYVWLMDPPVQESGRGTAVVTRTVRRTPPGAFDPTIKNLQWGDLNAGIMEARDRGAQYPLLTDGDGNLTEGAGYNVCIIHAAVLSTPDRGVLEGVTRNAVMEIARKAGLEVRLEVVPIASVYRADEIFVCSTAGGIMPITRLDGRVVGDGKVGKWTGRIWDAYWESHYDPSVSFAVDYDGGAVAQSERARL